MPKRCYCKADDRSLFDMPEEYCQTSTSLKPQRKILKCIVAQQEHLNSAQTERGLYKYAGNLSEKTIESLGNENEQWSLFTFSEPRGYALQEIID